MPEEFEWDQGDVATLRLVRQEMCLGEVQSSTNGSISYNADEGRMTHHYRHVVFPNADELKKCLANGPCVTFTVEEKSNSKNPGDHNGARPEGGFIHTYWHVKAGTVASDAKANEEWRKEEEQYQ